MYTVIDLFAGAGGLSLGFMQTHKYEVKAAFENNPDMQATYKLNHKIDVDGDVCKADYEDIKKKYGAIDVVIGGPPCQGFSNANRQKNHTVSRNNMLVKQYIRAILELQPRAFVMENVSMLRSDVHRFYLDEEDKTVIKEYHIPATDTIIPLLDSSFVFEGSSEIIRDLSLIEKNLWTEEKYASVNVVYKAAKNEKKLCKALKKYKNKLVCFANLNHYNKCQNYIENVSYKAFKAFSDYYNGELEADNVKKIIEPAVMVQRMLKKAKEIFDNHLVVERYEDSNGLSAVVKSYAVFDYLKAILGSAPNNYGITAGVLCAADYGAPQKRMRFIVMGIKDLPADAVTLPKGCFSEENYRTVKDAIEDIADVEPFVNVSEDKEEKGRLLTKKDNLGDLASSLRDSDKLKNHIITKTKEIAMERFKALKQGQNFHALDDALKKNTYTDVSRTQNTIYLRLDYNQPSGTVLNVRKSMWVHPVHDRAVSIREAARLQTFPDSFVFCGSKDKQYQQVGNAVPPIMAKAIAEHLAEQLDKNKL